MRIDEIIAKFKLHPEVDPENYQITNTLRSVGKWKARILSGNSMSNEKDVGDWEPVGYTMISTT